MSLLEIIEDALHARRMRQLDADNAKAAEQRAKELAEADAKSAAIQAERDAVQAQLRKLERDALQQAGQERREQIEAEMRRIAQRRVARGKRPLDDSRLRAKAASNLRGSR